MLVLDASVVLELLLRTECGIALASELLVEELAVPHLLDVEVTQVLRRYVLHGKLPAVRAQEAIVDLLDLPLQRYSHMQLMSRVWALRENLTAYDAVYVALAETLGGAMVTRDRRLARASQGRVETRIV